MNESVRRVLAVLKVSLLRLFNSRQEILLVFVVPVLFFSIFALIFSRGVGFKPKQVRMSIVNDDSSRLTQRIVKSLQQREQLNQVTGVGRTEKGWSVERLSRALISSLHAEIVVYFPPGYASSLSSSDPSSVQILSEGTNPVSADVVEAILAQTIATQRALAIGSANVAGIGGFAPHTVSIPNLAPESTIVKTVNAGNLQSASKPMVQLAAHSRPSTMQEDTPVFDKQNVFASNKHQPKVAMYAAGIAVMFLLFSSSGAGASLLEEKEAGTLGRLMSSKLSIGELLAGKWLYICLLGLMQITTMFVWGQLVFQVDLLGHLPGFIVMAIATASATASFALFLASICRTRNQLNGVSVVVVLGMSAVGGSMIPRYIMSESMQRLGKLTFNGWALDGFKKVFWYDLPVASIRIEVLVLISIAISFALAAQMFVRKWRMA